MKQLVIFVSLFFSVQTMLSQTILTVHDFTALVVKNHPLAKQAGLAITYGQGTLLKAKGGFDPKVNFGMDQKYYNGYQYYSEMNAGLKVPTWYGIEVKTGFESNRGSYLDPQNKLPDGGLWYGGLSLKPLSPPGWLGSSSASCPSSEVKKLIAATDRLGAWPLSV